MTKHTKYVVVEIDRLNPKGFTNWMIIYAEDTIQAEINYRRIHTSDPKRLLIVPAHNAIITSVDDAPIIMRER